MRTYLRLLSSASFYLHGLLEGTKRDQMEENRRRHAISQASRFVGKSRILAVSLPVRASA